MEMLGMLFEVTPYAFIIAVLIHFFSLMGPAIKEGKESWLEVFRVYLDIAYVQPGTFTFFFMICFALTMTVLGMLNITGTLLIRLFSLAHLIG